MAVAAAYETNQGFRTKRDAERFLNTVGSRSSAYVNPADARRTLADQLKPSGYAVMETAATSSRTHSAQTMKRLARTHLSASLRSLVKRRSGRRTGQPIEEVIETAAGLPRLNQYPSRSWSSSRQPF